MSVVAGKFTTTELHNALIMEAQAISRALQTQFYVDMDFTGLPFIRLSCS